MSPTFFQRLLRLPRKAKYDTCQEKSRVTVRFVSRKGHLRWRTNAREWFENGPNCHLAPARLQSLLFPPGRWSLFAKIWKNVNRAETCLISMYMQDAYARCLALLSDLAANHWNHGAAKWFAQSYIRDGGRWPSMLVILCLDAAFLKTRAKRTEISNTVKTSNAIIAVWTQGRSLSTWIASLPSTPQFPISADFGVISWWYRGHIARGISSLKATYFSRSDEFF